jgi:BNR repeat-like domain
MLGRNGLRLRLLPATVATLAAVVVATMPALAANEAVVKVSEDPYTNCTGTSPQLDAHATEVEPDTFASGSTFVTAFQVGRIFNGGACDIGWATTHNGGNSFTNGFLPSTTPASTPAGPFFAASDPSVAFDFRHHTWLISWLGAHRAGGGIVDVMVSRSTDGGISFSAPITVAASGTFFDKNWTACDNTPSSPFFGNCYTEFDDALKGDLEQMSTSSDGGLTWGPNEATADRAHGLGGQPVVQPNGRVVVPYEGLSGASGERSFTSDDGGATWNASVQISTRTSHRVAGNIRTSALPTAEINRDGTVFVAWQDRRFEPGGTANDIVMSTSTDGITWSPVNRIPIDAVGSNVDHFIPGLGVDSGTAGDHTLLALTYYFYPAADCTTATCQLEVGFTSSLDGGQTWADPEVLAGPISLSWIAPTTQGVMVGDYISTSFLAGQQRVLNAFAVGFAPSAGGSLNEPMFSGIEKVRGGSHSTSPDPVLFAPDSAAADDEVATTAF